MKQSFRLGLLGLLATVLLSGCSGLPNCTEPQPYMYAKQYPPLKNPPGLSVPAPDPDMAIPDVATGPVRHYDNPPNGAKKDSFAACLVAPPPMSGTGA